MMLITRLLPLAACLLFSSILLGQMPKPPMDATSRAVHLGKECMNPMVGIDAFDIVLLVKHISNTVLLASPYGIIAGDVNRSGGVSIVDAAEIRRLLLHIHTGFPANTSWRFVPASYIFPNPTDPWYEAFPECIQYNFGTDDPDQTDTDFIAIKIGDVNGSATNCSSFTNNVTEEREKKYDLIINNSQADLKLGDEATLDFYLSGPAALSAWQAGLRFDAQALELVEVLHSEGLDGMNLGNFGLTEADQGKVRALWYDRYGGAMSFAAPVKLFSLRFKALQPIQDIAKLVQLDDEVLRTSTFEADGREAGMKLGFADAATLATVTPSTALKVTSSPNPFKEKLRLFVQVQQAAYLDVMVFDALGRVVDTWSEYREPGEHEILFDRTERWGTGVFTWQVNTDKQTLSGKVVRE